MTSGVDGADGADVPAAGDPATARTDVELAAVPGLGGLYARGVATSARLAALSRLGRASDALPRVAYVARGVQADPDRLSAYQGLLGEPASDALPAGYVHVLAFPVATALMVRDDFPLPLAGMVHVANRVQQHRAPVLGEPLDVRAHAQDLRPHRAGAQVDLVTEVRSDGDVVWRGVSTYLAKGVRLPAGRSGPGAGASGAAGAAARAHRAVGPDGRRRPPVRRRVRGPQPDPPVPAHRSRHGPPPADRARDVHRLPRARLGRPRARRRVRLDGRLREGGPVAQPGHRADRPRPGGWRVRLLRLGRALRVVAPARDGRPPVTG
jgi:hypothetical protein